MNNKIRKENEVFENLFILELANNHWGSVERGLSIIRDHAAVMRYNGIKAAIKLQFRDVDSFIHDSYKGNTEIRYIKKTEATKLSKEDFARLVTEVKRLSAIPMATPFDENSVDLCVEFGMPIIKIASSDINDWVLIEKIASKKLPVIVSTGGASEKNIDDIVRFFEHRNIPLAINHCISLYPSEDHQLELNQLDYLKQRYTGHVIGLSTHEYHSWDASMYISYAKGARSWERHIDIDDGKYPVSPYCSTPEKIDIWFKAFNKAKEMCGSASEERRICSKNEIEYLDALVRGVYAKNDIEPGYIISNETFSKDFYLAIPLQKGQLSCREIINGEMIVNKIPAGSPLKITDIDNPYSKNNQLTELIQKRGV